jgi:hypothetical protein
MKKYYMLLVFLAAFLTQSTVLGQAGCSTLNISSTTPGSVCGNGFVVLGAASSGTGDDVFWYDAATGGNLMGIGTSFQTPVISTTTTFYATEILLDSPTGGTLPTYCTPKILDTGCGSGDDIHDFTLTSPSGVKIIEHLATACSTDNYGDFTGDANLTGNLIIGNTYDFTITHEFLNSQYVKIWIDFNVDGDFSDTGEEVFASASGTTNGMPTTGSITVPSSVLGATTVMRIVDIYNQSPSDPCTPSGTFGETHDYKVNLVSVLCESPRVAAVATVNNLADKNIAALPYSDTDDTANYDDNYSGSPGCATAGEYLGGNEVLYHYTADDDYILTVSMSGLSASESGVFVYESCADIGTLCVDGGVNSTSGNYSFNVAVQNGEDYYFVVSSSATTGTVGYTIDITAVPLDCTAYQITATTDGTIQCLGTADLQATGSGTAGAMIYWYDMATGGQPIASGSTFQTPKISTTTPYWAAEVFVDGAGFQTGQGKQVPGGTDIGFTNPAGLQFDAFQTFTLTSIEVYSAGTGGTLNIELQDPLGGPPQTASASIPASFGTSVTIPLNFTVTPGVGYKLMKTSGPELLADFSWNGGASFPYPIGLNSATGEITSGVTGFGNPSNYYYFYNWTINQGSILCESTRMQATATVSTSGDVAVTSLPYTTSDNTSNYANTYMGMSGTGCGTPYNYLNGNDVLYKFTATSDNVVDILMSNLSGFYAGVFVYDSCADLGTNCLAGAVAGPSDNGFGIKDFPITTGEDYYILVSSWLTPTVGYTLEILPFDCSTFEPPVGDANQDFVAGDQLLDLAIDSTRTNAVLNYYSNPGGTTSIPDTTTLVDNATYYVSQTFYGCESPLLAITVHEIDCSVLDISSTTGDSVSCKGSMSLTAVASGNGDEIYWYDAPTGGNIVNIGDTYDTPVLTLTTSYWVSEAILMGGGIVKGLANTVYSGDSFFFNNNDYGLQFSASQTFTLVSVEVYPLEAAGTLTVELQDSSGNMLQSRDVPIPSGNGSTAATVPLNFVVQAGTGTDYRLVKTAGPNVGVDFSWNGGVTYPYPLGNVGEITSGITPFGTTIDYMYFFNWTINEGEFACESTPRKEVIATVLQSGEVTLDYNDLPYTTTDNTVNYGNDFSGDPGAGCVGSGYLGGNDVVYQYTADPANDDILDIEVSGINNANTGVFIYASCGDVGTSCLTGDISEGNSTINIEDYFVAAGQEVFIVISTETGLVNYTLTINGVDCNNVELPVADQQQFFVSGDNVDALDVDGNPHKTGFKWYEDMALSTPISTPATTPLVDGENYFVTQEVLGCESAAIEIIAVEFDCSSLGITSAPDVTICAPGGDVALTAQSQGLGSNIYWYDAQTAGNTVFAGNIFNTNITANTSFWVSEVFIDKEDPLPGQGKTSYQGTNFSANSNYGLQFSATKSFTLVSLDVYPTGASGDLEIELRDAIGNTLQSTTVSIPAGNGSAPVTIPIGFDVPPGQNYELVSGSAPDLGVEFSWNGGISFPYPLGNSGAAGQITADAGPFGNFTDYYYFYNWTIEVGNVVCESARQEVVVSLNNQPTPDITGNASQKFCDGATISDIVVMGTNLNWYADLTGGEALSPDTILQDGENYYGTQTIGGCESTTRFEVVTLLTPVADIPVGDTNQAFYLGETIADLNVQGDNLTWYVDANMSQTLPTSTTLVDQETYYVSQEPTNFCESELLSVTVHSLGLGAEDPVFGALSYYPNPVGDQLEIKNTIAMEAVSLYNLLGEKLMEKQIGSNKTTLNTSGLSSGVYFLKVEIDGKAGVFKLIKK